MHLSAPSRLVTSTSYRAIYFIVMMGLCQGPVDTGCGGRAAHLCRKWPSCLMRRGQSSQTLETEPAASCFLTLSCRFIINPAALQPERALAGPVGWGAALSLVKLRRARSRTLHSCTPSTAGTHWSPEPTWWQVRSGTKVPGM